MSTQTILSEPMDDLEGFLSTFRTRLEGVFQRGLVSLDKKQLSQVRLDDGLLECLATLPPKSRDEELEDLIYFILDLYQFHGIPVAIAEVDIDQLIIDLRNMLEDYASCTQSRTAPLADSHTFLVLDKNVEGLPWESIPVLRGKSVSRVPNLDFILDRLDLAKQQRHGDHPPDSDTQTVLVDRVTIDPRKTFYALNPSGDLKSTEGRFSDWLTEMKSVGWRGLISQPPSEQQFLDALSTQDLVLWVL
jgi:separase